MSPSYLVVAMLEPCPQGTTFAASRWPLHVTVSTNVSLPLDAAAAESLVADAVRHEPPFVVGPGVEALFGPAADVPVVLVDPPDRLRSLHARLAAALRAAGGTFLGSYVDERYRPHATTTPTARLSGPVQIATLSLVDRTPNGNPSQRRVLAELHLAAS